MKGTGKESKKSPAKEEVKPAPVEFNDPLNLIELLSETNFGLVLQALKGLKSFVRQNQLQMLLDNGLLEKIIFLIQEKKSTSEIIEFSIELLAELLHFKTFIVRVTDEEELILHLYNLFKTKPLDIQVQCVKCLSSLTSVDSVCELVSEKCDLNLLFTRVTQKDPDVQANVLKIIMNLVKANLVIAEKMVNQPGFSYPPLFNLLNSDYPIVQHRALNLIICYTSFDHVTILRQIFIEEQGVNALIKMLETHKWPDMHEKVFTILNDVGCLDEAFDKLGETGIKKLIEYVDDIESQKLQFACLDTILTITNKSPHGLKLFVEYGLLDLVLNHLKDKEESLMFRLSIRGLAVLSSDSDALLHMEEDTSLLLTLFEVLENSAGKFDWTIRLDAATAIFLMMTKSQVFYDTLMEQVKWQIILDLLNTDLTNTPEKVQLQLAHILKRLLLDMYKQISCPDNLCNQLVHILKHLMMNPKIPGNEIKCIATEMVEDLVEYRNFREALKENKVYRSLAKLLFRTSEHLSILEAYLKLFITLIEWDEGFIDELTYAHAISWFIEKRDLHRSLPIARRFLDLVFEKCKYLKIHFTNRLEPWDKIDSGFYLTRTFSTKKNDFKSLKSYIREKYLKARPIYYIDFDNNGMVDKLKQSCIVLSNISFFDESVSMYSMDTTADDSYALGFETLRDPFLKLKLKELKKLLGYQPDQLVPLNLSESLNREEYIEKIKILSDFVIDIMTSVDDEDDDCRNHSFELHLAEIKEDLASSVIPLGYLKLGSKFEKALLFKTLGDHVGIPSAFIRAHCGNGWNEVYLTPAKETKEESLSWLLPNKEKNDRQRSISQRKSDAFSRKTSHAAMTGRKSMPKMERKSSKKSIPSKSIVSENGESLLPPSWYLHAYQSYMKTNHVVDLDRNPGHIYQIGSVEADEYTSELAPVHPYFFPATTIPPLIKSSTINLPQEVVA